jgi:hypothetical protein
VRLFDTQVLQAALQHRQAARDMPPAQADAVTLVSALVPETAESSAGAGSLATAPEHIGVYARSFVPVAEPGLVLMRMPSAAAQTAQELFATLRALDDAGVQQIWVERVPTTPDWAGVADRLQRASA